MADILAADNLADRLWQECPRRICGHLHVAGWYRHYKSNSKPDKVLCFHRDATLTQEYQCTDAQIDRDHDRECRSLDASAAAAQQEAAHKL